MLPGVVASLSVRVSEAPYVLAHRCYTCLPIERVYTQVDEPVHSQSA